MYTLFTNPLFAPELAVIAQFNGQSINTLSSYEQIMENLTKTTNTAQATQVIKAFEKVIMYLYDYRAYAYGSYKPWKSIAITGIKWTWINPFAYFNPKNYFSDNPELVQLIDELSNIAEIAKRHSMKDAIRLELTVHSYRHWRTYAAVTIATCAGLYVKKKYNMTFDIKNLNPFSKSPISSVNAVLPVAQTVVATPNVQATVATNASIVTTQAVQAATVTPLVEGLTQNHVTACPASNDTTTSIPNF